MSLPIGNTIGILADNLEKRKSVLPLSGRTASAWAQGLDIPAGGRTVIYTGQMYQLVPGINSMAHQLARYENSWLTGYFGVARTANKVLNLSALMSRSDSGEQRAYNRPLRNMARLLRAAGIEFGYLYEADLYSGALVYDEGVDDVFVAHARKVSQVLRDRGVELVITTDPHTTNMLRSIYPEVVDGFDIQVKSYLEVLAESKLDVRRSLDMDVAVHDSCVYARYESVVEQPRALLEKGGARIQEAELSGKLTHCCGGPLESLFPGKATEIAKKRIGQLAGCASQVITMCPICLANLKRAAPSDVVVRDISDYLVDIYCPDSAG